MSFGSVVPRRGLSCGNEVYTPGSSISERLSLVTAHLRSGHFLHKTTAFSFSFPPKERGITEGVRGSSEEAVETKYPCTLRKKSLLIIVLVLLFRQHQTCESECLGGNDGKIGDFDDCNRMTYLSIAMAFCFCVFPELSSRYPPLDRVEDRW